MIAFVLALLVAEILFVAWALGLSLIRIEEHRPRTPMGYDDRGRLVAYNPALHATTEHRLMLAQVRAWTPRPEWSSAT